MTSAYLGKPLKYFFFLFFSVTCYSQQIGFLPSVVVQLDCGPCHGVKALKIKYKHIWMHYSEKGSNFYAFSNIPKFLHDLNKPYGFFILLHKETYPYIKKYTVTTNNHDWCLKYHLNVANAIPLIMQF